MEKIFEPPTSSSGEPLEGTGMQCSGLWGEAAANTA